MSNLRVDVNPRLVVKQDGRNIKIETCDGVVIVERADLAQFEGAVALVIERIMREMKG